MTTRVYVKIHSHVQGAFIGDATGDRQGWINVLEFRYATSPIDPTTGQRQQHPHSSLTWVKRVGRSSVQLIQAAKNNELLDSVVFEVTETSPAKGIGLVGAEQVVEQFTVQGVSVASIIQQIKAPEAGTSAEATEVDEVGFAFSDIQVLTTADPSGTDNWSNGDQSPQTQQQDHPVFQPQGTQLLQPPTQLRPTSQPHITHLLQPPPQLRPLSQPRLPYAIQPQPNPPSPNGATNVVLERFGSSASAPTPTLSTSSFAGPRKRGRV
jgi:type VI secretion system Hcp family effector